MESPNARTHDLNWQALGIEPADLSALVRTQNRTSFVYMLVQDQPNTHSYKYFHNQHHERKLMFINKVYVISHMAHLNLFTIG